MAKNINRLSKRELNLIKKLTDLDKELPDTLKKRIDYINSLKIKPISPPCFLSYKTVGFKTLHLHQLTNTIHSRA